MLLEAVRMVSESVERVCEAASQVGEGLIRKSLQTVSPSELINTSKACNHTGLRLNRRPQFLYSCMLNPTSWWNMKSWVWTKFLFFTPWGCGTLTFCCFRGLSIVSPNISSHRHNFTQRMCTKDNAHKNNAHHKKPSFRFQWKYPLWGSLRFKSDIKCLTECSIHFFFYYKINPMIG